MKSFIKFNTLSVFIFLLFCYLSYGTNTFAQNRIYQADNNEKYRFFEAKEKLIEAISKTSLIVSRDFKIYFKSSTKKINNIDKLQMSRLRVVITGTIDKTQEVRTFILKEPDDVFNTLEVVIFEMLTNDEDHRYTATLKDSTGNYWCFFWNKDDLKYGKQFSDALYSLPAECTRITSNASILGIKSFIRELKRFEDVAQKYRDMNPKPEPSDFILKYIIQAESYSEDKNYKKAIESLEDFLSPYKSGTNAQLFPLVHYNLALVLATVEDYEYAVFEMKKYLMLVPFANDAKDAQTMIYKWEAKIEK